MPKVLVASLCVAVAAMANAANAASEAEPAVPTATVVPVQQNRDEPGRNPYQVHVVFPADCGVQTCTLHFPKITASERVVVEQVSCTINTPNSTNPTTAFLYGKARDPYLRSYLPMMYQSTFLTWYYYIISTPVLFYFNTGDTPSIDIYISGSSTSPKGDCALSGYRVHLP